MTRGPLAEGAESGDFRGGAGGGEGGMNSFCKNIERGTEIMHMLDLPRRDSGLTFTGVGGLTSLSLARASFLGSLLFNTNRPGDLWDRMASQITTVSLRGKKDVGDSSIIQEPSKNLLESHYLDWLSSVGETNQAQH